MSTGRGKVVRITPNEDRDFESDFIMAKSSLLAVTDLMTEMDSQEQLHEHTVMNLGSLLRDLANEMNDAFNAALAAARRNDVAT